MLLIIHSTLFSSMLLLFLIISLFALTTNSYSSYPISNSFAQTASTKTTIQDGAIITAEATTMATASNAFSTSGNYNSVNTFHLRGQIGSLVTSILNPSNILHRGQQQYFFSSATDEYVVVGNWTMDVKDGIMEYFRVDFVMALNNGTQMHVHEIGNFRNVVIIPPSPNVNGGVVSNQTTKTIIPTKITLSQTDNYSLSLYGSVDVITNGKLQWQDVPVTIDIFNGSVISIFLDPSYTDNHFKGVPIYGVAVWILDENYRPIKPSAFTYH